MVSEGHSNNINLAFTHDGNENTISLAYPSGKRILASGEGGRFFATTLSAFAKEMGHQTDQLEITLNQVVRLASALFPRLDLSAERATLLSAIAEQLVMEPSAPATPGQPGQYQKLTVDGPDHNEQVVTIQVIRQSKYPDWLALPFPTGDMPVIPNSLFSVYSSADRLKEALSWDIPLLAAMSKDSLAQTDFKKDWYTDLELEHFRAQGTQVHLTSALTLNDIKSRPTIPRMDSPMAALSNAWGILLETIFVARYLKSIQDGKASSEGTWLKARSDSWALSVIRDLSGASSSYRALGFGTGRVHLAVPAGDAESLGRASGIAMDHSAFTYTQDGKIQVPQDFEAIGAEKVFISLLRENNAEKLAIADREIQHVFTNTIRYVNMSV